MQLLNNFQLRKSIKFDVDHKKNFIDGHKFRYSDILKG